MAWTTSAYLRARPTLMELSAGRAKAALLLKFLVLKYVLRAMPLGTAALAYGSIVDVTLP